MSVVAYLGDVHVLVLTILLGIFLLNCNPLCFLPRYLSSNMIFAYYQVRATGHARDGLFRQQQVLLRTLPMPSSIVADSAKIWYTWRHRSKRALPRSSLLVVIATLYTFGSLVAS